MENFGQKLKRFRKDKSISVPQLERVLGIPKDRIYKWEKGATPSDPDEYQKVINYMDSGGKLESITNKIGLPLIPMSAMAGFANGSKEILELECERYVVPNFRGADYLITVKGSSMYPKYNSGDIVACKKLNINDIFFQWNKVYVIDTDQGPLIKRIKKGTDDQHILAVSENADFDPFELHVSKIYSIALVVGCIRME